MLHFDHVTWPSVGLTPHFGYKAGMCFYEQQCVRIGPLINCRQEQVNHFLLLFYEYLWCEIYHLTMVYIDISDH